MNKVVLSTRKYKVGYEVREEIHETNFEAVALSEVDEESQGIIDFINSHKGEHVIVKSAYTPSGDYIGDKRRAHFLYTKMGIKPQKVDNDHKVCSIGWCETERKWYGWSHRAIYGFGIGDIVSEGDCTNSSGWTEEYLAQHLEKDLSLPVGFRAEDFNDAKRMAIAFAESVG